MELNNNYQVKTPMAKYILAITHADTVQVFDAIATSDDLERTIEKLMYESPEQKKFTICTYDINTQGKRDIVSLSSISIIVSEVIPIMATTEGYSQRGKNIIKDFKQYYLNKAN